METEEVLQTQTTDATTAPVPPGGDSSSILGLSPPSPFSEWAGGFSTFMEQEGDARTQAAPPALDRQIPDVPNDPAISQTAEDADTQGTQEALDKDKEVDVDALDDFSKIRLYAKGLKTDLQGLKPDAQLVREFGGRDVVQPGAELMSRWLGIREGTIEQDYNLLLESNPERMQDLFHTSLVLNRELAAQSLFDAAPERIERALSNLTRLEESGEAESLFDDEEAEPDTEKVALQKELEGFRQQEREFREHQALQLQQERVGAFINQLDAPAQQILKDLDWGEGTQDLKEYALGYAQNLLRRDPKLNSLLETAFTHAASGRTQAVTAMTPLVQQALLSKLTPIVARLSKMATAEAQLSQLRKGQLQREPHIPTGPPVIGRTPSSVSSISDPLSFLGTTRGPNPFDWGNGFAEMMDKG